MSNRVKKERDVTKDDRAIEALLSCTNLHEAAKQAGVPYSTFRRLIYQDDFQVKLNEAKRAVSDAALVNLRGLAQKAVDVIEKALNSNDVSVAKWIIDKNIQARGDDTEERLARLEDRLGPVRIRSVR